MLMLVCSFNFPRFWVAQARPAWLFLQWSCLKHANISSWFLKQLLAAELGLEPDGDAAESTKCSIESRFSPLATCHKGDVILFNAGQGGYRAGKVQLHFEILGMPISMVLPFEVHKHEAHCGHAVWRPEQNNCFIETDQIPDTVVYSSRPDGKVAVLAPMEFRWENKTKHQQMLIYLMPIPYT